MEASEHTKLTAEIIELQTTILRLRSQIEIEKMRTESKKDFYESLFNQWQETSEIWKELYFNLKNKTK
jgi:hypothetical protein